ncbi:mucin-5AC [Alosa sapidissima]|uniref:mucin-5AC n=1 Tax=Alosa sapidissima TaxID=34773 RepID=UPI001C09DC42|nr:mucin-5AC [Alosa sapidissima]
MVLYAQRRKMVWTLLSVGFCVFHVLAESTLSSLLNVNNTMATPGVNKTNDRYSRISTVTESSATSMVSDATTAQTNTTTTTTTITTKTITAETNKTLPADKVVLIEGTAAEPLVENTNISKTTHGLTTNSELNTPQTKPYVLAAITTPRPPIQQQVTASFTSPEEHNATQNTGSGPTTAQWHAGPQPTPSPSPLGIEVTQGHLEAAGSSQPASPGPEWGITEGQTDSAPFEQTTIIDRSVNYTTASEAALTQGLGYTHFSLSHSKNSTQAGPDSMESEVRTDSMTTQNTRRYDANANMTLRVHLKLTTDRVTRTTTPNSTIFTTLRTVAVTAGPSAALHTPTDIETDTSNISLPVNSTSGPDISIQLRTLTTTTMKMTTGGLRPEDLQTETKTNISGCTEGRPSPCCTRLACFLTIWGLALAASFFLGLNIFLWVRLSAVRKSGRWETDARTRAGGAQRGAATGDDGSLWANPRATVEERVEFWYANGTMTNSSDRHRGPEKERRRDKWSERKGGRMNGSLWPQPKVTMSDITEFWYGRERPTGKNHQTILEEEEAQ